jgi:hypothetical protein
MLGIPTLTDRLIQQALHQVLSPTFEAEFSESSYGFRPGRNARQAVKVAKQYVVKAAGSWWIDVLDDLLARLSRLPQCASRTSYCSGTVFPVINRLFEPSDFCGSRPGPVPVLGLTTGIPLVCAGFA